MYTVYAIEKFNYGFNSCVNIIWKEISSSGKEQKFFYQTREIDEFSILRKTETSSLISLEGKIEKQKSLLNFPTVAFCWETDNSFGKRLWLKLKDQIESDSIVQPFYKGILFLPSDKFTNKEKEMIVHNEKLKIIDFAARNYDSFLFDGTFSSADFRDLSMFYRGLQGNSLQSLFLGKVFTILDREFAGNIVALAKNIVERTDETNLNLKEDEVTQTLIYLSDKISKKFSSLSS